MSTTKPNATCNHNHDHNHGHNHGHGHGHHHHHATDKLGLAFFLNLCFSLIEFVGGILTNSMAIISDALHDLGDSVAIGFAWYLEKKSLRPSDNKFSYGHRRLSTLSALITGCILVVGSCLILVKSIPRLINPEMPNIQGMLLLSLLGIAVNGWAAFKMSKGSSLNEKMILLHLIEDVLGWAFVFIGSIVMMIHPIPILDPIMACILALWVLFNAIKNLRGVLRVFLQGVPEHVSQQDIQTLIQQHAQVADIHHFHLWSIDGAHHLLTTHLVMSKDVTLEDAHHLKVKIKAQLKEKFHIIESTIELEWPNHSCPDPAH